MALVDKIDGIAVSHFIAEQNGPLTLPVTPVWKGRLPSSFGSFGAKVNKVARKVFGGDRMGRKGTTVGITANATFTEDLTQTNLFELLQGFFFANASEKPDTQPLNAVVPNASGAIAITSVSGTQFAGTGLDTRFGAGMLLKASGFGIDSNNGLKLVTATTSGALTCAGLTAEASPPLTARLECVGFQFAASDAALTVASGVASLQTTAKDLTTLNLKSGEPVFLGGDDAATSFSVTGFARIKSIAANNIVFDKVSGPFATDAATGDTVRIFFGKYLCNDVNQATHVKRFYQQERWLGVDGVGAFTQAEYIVGTVPNTLTASIQGEEKITVELGYVALDRELRTSAQGVKSGTRVYPIEEDAFNGTNDIPRSKMTLLSPGTLQPTDLFAYTTSFEITVNNNVTVNKRIGQRGGFNVTVGSYDIAVAADYYFTNTDAIKTVETNPDCTLDIVVAKNNGGHMIDFPLLGVATEELKIAMEEPIMIPVTSEGVKSKTPAGHAMSWTQFNYLPTAAMPV